MSDEQSLFWTLRTVAGFLFFVVVFPAVHRWCRKHGGAK